MNKCCVLFPVCLFVLFIYLLLIKEKPWSHFRYSVLCRGSSALIGQEVPNCTEGAGPLGREQEKKAGGPSKAER